MSSLVSLPIVLLFSAFYLHSCKGEDVPKQQPTIIDRQTLTPAAASH